MHQFTRGSVITARYKWPGDSYLDDGTKERPCLVLGALEESLLICPTTTQPPRGTESRYAQKMTPGERRSLGLRGDDKETWILPNHTNIVETPSPAIVKSTRRRDGAMVAEWSYGSVSNRRLAQIRHLQSRAMSAGQDIHARIERSCPEQYRHAGRHDRDAPPQSADAARAAESRAIAEQIDAGKTRRRRPTLSLGGAKGATAEH